MKYYSGIILSILPVEEQFGSAAITKKFREGESEGHQHQENPNSLGLP
jgi:hypothetical protein